MLKLNNGKKTEFYCTHASFQITDADGPKLEEFEAIQKRMNASFNENSNESMNYILNDDNNNLMKDENGGFLWNRKYAENTDAKVCDNIPDDTTFVVGHCTTPSTNKGFARIKSVLDGNAYDKYAGCNIEEIGKGTDKGCVVLDCYDKSKRPKLVFVDAMMSQCFHLSKNPKYNVEFLLLEHDLNKTSDKYINKISRKPAGGKAIEMWATRTATP